MSIDIQHNGVDMLSEEIEKIRIQIELGDIIDGLSYEQVKELRDELVARYGKPEVKAPSASKTKKPAVDAGKALQEIDRIYNSEVSDDYVPDADEYGHELDRVLSEYVPALIEAVMYDKANEILVSAFEKTDIEGDFDEYSYAIETVTDDCMKYWREIARKCSHPFKMEFMESLRKLVLKSRNYDNGCSDLRTLIAEEFNDAECCKRRLEWADEDIALAAECKWGQPTRDRLMATRVNEKTALMKGMGLPKTEVESVIKKYWALHDVREQFVEDLLADGKHDEAILVLIESRKLDREDSSAVADETLKLADLYQEMGKANEYKRELSHYIFDIELPFNCSNSKLLDLIKKLKAACEPEEWVRYREKMLKSDRFSAGLRHDIMAEDGLYERLLNELLQYGSVTNVDSYEKILKPLFPNRLMMFYADYIVRLVPKITKMKDYAEPVKYLKKIASYTGGDALANEIASQWKTEYSRKVSFMDDLKKAGF